MVLNTVFVVVGAQNGQCATGSKILTRTRTGPDLDNSDRNWIGTGTGLQVERTRPNWPDIFNFNAQLTYVLQVTKVNMAVLCYKALVLSML